jgi:ribonuclease P protein component
MARCGLFILKTKPAKIANDPRYGLVASKKSFKLATQRNRAKRLIRDWISYNEDLMSSNLDYVFILGTDILNSDRENGRNEVKRAFNKILKLLKTTDNDEKK